MGYARNHSGYLQWEGSFVFIMCTLKFFELSFVYYSSIAPYLKFQTQKPLKLSRFLVSLFGSKA